jgi:hypothetical protein
MWDFVTKTIVMDNAAETSLGTQLARANAVACPQLAEADLRLIRSEAGFGP